MWDTGSVPERCTCGAQLPPDALFCHKCGKPQRELSAVVEPEALPPPLPPPPVAAPPPIGFHNGTAVRTALMAGILAFAYSLLTVRLVPQAFTPYWLIASGFLAGFLTVFLYRRRTGQRLSVVSGARLGWICGIFGFVVVAILLTMTAVALTDPVAVSAMREQLKTQVKSDADVNQVIDFFRSATGVGGILAGSFLLFTVLPAFGGAVGAKLLDRD